VAVVALLLDQYKASFEKKLFFADLKWRRVDKTDSQESNEITRQKR
jgi:hypothetical protein